MQKYSEIGEWFKDCRVLPDDEWDDIHLFTGEEGAGKSRKMRQIMKKLDPSFDLDRIHFTQDSFLDQAVTLDPGQAIILDEWRGHKRLAMHGERMEFLDFTKECRGLRLHVGIGFPHVDQTERDILFQRIRWWNYSPLRELLIVHKRFGKQRLGPDGKPVTEVRFKEVGKFPFPKDAPDPLGPGYVHIKDARMRDRAARYREAHGKDLGAQAPAPRRVNMEFFDQVLQDIKQAA